MSLIRNWGRCFCVCALVYAIVFVCFGCGKNDDVNKIASTNEIKKVDWRKDEKMWKNLNNVIKEKGKTAAAATKARKEIHRLLGVAQEVLKKRGIEKPTQKQMLQELSDEKKYPEWKAAKEAYNAAVARAEAEHKAAKREIRESINRNKSNLK